MNFSRRERSGPRQSEPVTEEPPVADYTYTFCVGTETPADIDGSEAVDVFDFGILAANFATSGCNVPGDMNADGIVDVLDFGIFAVDFERTGLGACSAGTESAAASSGAGMEALVQSLGYKGVGEYTAWLQSLTKAEQIAEIAALFELSKVSGE